MLCGKCKKPLVCKYCGEVEYSRDEDIEDEHERRFYECRCDKFRSNECEECAKIKVYVNKDIMWYVKSIVEAILILIMTICLVGFVVGMIFVLIAIPMVWGKPLSYQPFPWLNCVMAWSICVGLVNLLFLFSLENDWRDHYEDRSMVFNIKEKRDGI